VRFISRVSNGRSDPPHTVGVEFPAGPVSFRLDYEQHSRPARCTLLWRPARSAAPFVPVPPEAFSPGRPPALKAHARGPSGAAGGGAATARRGRGPSSLPGATLTASLDQTIGRAPPSADSMEQALEDYLATEAAGTAPPRAEFLARYPELARQDQGLLA